MIEEKLLISEDISIRDAIEKLVNGGRKAVFIVSEDMKLVGLFTNGDMRKLLLTNTDFSLPISSVMNRTPISFRNRTEAIDFAKNRSLVVYPIVEDGFLVDIIYDDDSCFTQESYKALYNVPLVIMAGGKGTRLYPYTKVLPKALMPIGDYTISERIIRSFTKFGCRDVLFILNHKGGMIRAYFNDLKKEYNVQFISEETFLGTGGGLRLIKDKIDGTFILSNCDILIEDDLSCAYQTHLNNKNMITMVCSSKEITIPYGVIKSNEAGDILDMDEKPKLNYLVNTGVYVIEPQVIDLIEKDETIGMPDLIKRCSDRGMKVGIFPISDRAWFDMGQFEEMDKMLEHFGMNGR